MNCHLGVDLQLIEYVDSRLSDSARTGVEAHLADCDECGDWVETYRLLANALSPCVVDDVTVYSAQAHLSSVELVRYALVYRTLDEVTRERCARHVAGCTDCASEVTLVRAASLDSQSEEHASVPPGVPSSGGVLSSAVLRPLTWAAGLVLVVGALWVGQLIEWQPAGSTLLGQTTVEVPEVILVEATRVEAGMHLTLKPGQAVGFGEGFAVTFAGTLAVVTEVDPVS